MAVQFWGYLKFYWPSGACALYFTPVLPLWPYRQWYPLHGEKFTDQSKHIIRLYDNTHSDYGQTSRFPVSGKQEWNPGAFFTWLGPFITSHIILLDKTYDLIKILLTPITALPGDVSQLLAHLNEVLGTIVSAPRLTLQFRFFCIYSFIRVYLGYFTVGNDAAFTAILPLLHLTLYIHRNLHGRWLSGYVNLSYTCIRGCYVHRLLGSGTKSKFGRPEEGKSEEDSILNEFLEN